MKPIHSVIKRPLMTEKSTGLKDDGNCVVFEVAEDANKNEIRNAVEKIFKVHVLSVNTMITRGKVRAHGRMKIEKKKPNWKKAMVRIKEGEKIEFFEGV